MTEPMNEGRFAGGTSLTLDFRTVGGPGQYLPGFRRASLSEDTVRGC